MMKAPISPLSLDPLTRDLWGQYDASAIQQYAPFYGDNCYAPKFYKAPNTQQEVFPAGGYVAFGLRITPGSVIFGFYLPMVPNTGSLPASAPPKFTVQITDWSLKHQWFDTPLASIFLSNYKPTQQGNGFSGAGSFPNLLEAPYPVVGKGNFQVEIQSTDFVNTQRIELVFGVMEVCKTV